VLGGEANTGGLRAVAEHAGAQPPRDGGRDVTPAAGEQAGVDPHRVAEQRRIRRPGGDLAAQHGDRLGVPDVNLGIGSK